MQVARPVLSGDREERLRAQGVPASIVASMRTFEEQQLRQNAQPSPGLSATQPPEPDQAQEESSTAQDAMESGRTAVEPAGNAGDEFSAANASQVQSAADSPPGAEGSSAKSDDTVAAGASGHAEPVQQSTAPLGQDHDRGEAAAVPEPVPAGQMGLPAASQQDSVGAIAKRSEAEGLTPHAD